MKDKMDLFKSLLNFGNDLFEMYFDKEWIKDALDYKDPKEEKREERRKKLERIFKDGKYNM
jgi:CRISPR/Cas system endoribonuclease Cas6 (RAMP superfamily)